MPNNSKLIGTDNIKKKNHRMASKHEGEGTEKTSNNFVTTQVSK
jgi:hypothetical protein